ncbi:iron-sulfur cluster assembly scaffold protein [Candidatus Woesearchaeota archaeon]|nr:MAG: iron-sulfur cluster assembly scaffold protein [Candidatus Woesearchaeota archaeon]
MTYTKKVMEHFMHPKNTGEIKQADSTGEAGNLACGDIIKIYLKITKNKKQEPVIKDIKFKAFGCAAAIATSSALTEIAKGKTLKKALQITNKEVIKELGGLPTMKIHCSLIGIDALKAAIYNYLKKNKKEIPEELKKEYKKIHKTIEKIKKRQCKT